MLTFNWSELSYVALLRCKEVWLMQFLFMEANAVFIHEKVKVKVAQLCLTLCDHIVYTVHGIFQAKYWSGYPFPTPDRRSQGIFPTRGLNPGLPHCR